jgi:hypothetical protein
MPSAVELVLAELSPDPTRSRLAEIPEGFLDELKSFLGERQV